MNRDIHTGEFSPKEAEKRITFIQLASAYDYHEYIYKN